MRKDTDGTLRNEDLFQGSRYIAPKVWLFGVTRYPFQCSLLILWQWKATANIEIMRLLLVYRYALWVLSWSWHCNVANNISYVKLRPLHCNESIYNPRDDNCTYTTRQDISIVPNFAVFLVGFIQHPTNIVSIIVSFGLTVSCSSLQMISNSAYIDHHMWILMNDSHFSSDGIWFNLAATPCVIFELETLNTFESTGMILSTFFIEDLSEIYFCDQWYILPPCII